MANQINVHSYSSVNVTTSAYVTLVDATTIACSEIIVTDSSTKIIKLATGGTPVAAVAAVGTLDLTADIVLTSVAAGATRNTTTFQTVVAAAAANPTNTILAVFTGTSAAIICTITPNDGTNNGAVAVNLTTAQLAALINTGLVSGKVITLTDASTLRALQTATGGGAQNLAAGGEGDGVTATFAGGVNVTTTGEVDLFQCPVSGTLIIPVDIAQIPIGTRLSLKAIDASATTGYSVVTLLS